MQATQVKDFTAMMAMSLPKHKLSFYKACKKQKQKKKQCCYKIVTNWKCEKKCCVTF